MQGLGQHQIFTRPNMKKQENKTLLCPIGETPDLFVVAQDQGDLREYFPRTADQNLFTEFPWWLRLIYGSTAKKITFTQINGN